MDAIGLRIEFKKDKLPELRKLARQGKIPMRGDGWNADYPDAENFMQLLYGPNVGQANYSRFNLPEFNKLYDEARRLPDSPQRTKLFSRMTELVVAYAPWRVTDQRSRGHVRAPVGAQLRAASDPLADLDVHRRRRGGARESALKRGAGAGMFRTIGALFVVVAFGASALPARAATAWTPLGPPGGIVYALVTDPTSPRTLYAGVHGGGVLKSSRRGRNVDGRVDRDARLVGAFAGARRCESAHAVRRHVERRRVEDHRRRCDVEKDVRRAAAGRGDGPRDRPAQRAERLRRGRHRLQ